MRSSRGANNARPPTAPGGKGIAPQTPAAEALLAFQLRAVGIEFVQQYIYAPPRRLRADFAFLRPRGLLVEIQGGVWTRKAHGSITGILADIDRLNAATLAHWALIRATPDMVRDGRALKLIEQALSDG